MPKIRIPLWTYVKLLPAVRICILLHTFKSYVYINENSRRVSAWNPKWNFISPWKIYICCRYFSLRAKWNKICFGVGGVKWPNKKNVRKSARYRGKYVGKNNAGYILKNFNVKSTTKKNVKFLYLRQLTHSLKSIWLLILQNYWHYCQSSCKGIEK